MKKIIYGRFDSRKLCAGISTRLDSIQNKLNKFIILLKLRQSSEKNYHVILFKYVEDERMKSHKAS